jgi:hypothetical protein
MVAAQRNGEFVADLAAKGSRLCKFEVMGVTGGALANQAGLSSDKREVRLVSLADCFAQRRHPARL